MSFGIVAHRPDLLPGPLVAEQVRGSGKPGFVPALDALTDYPIRDRLGEIACPTLIVWGADDKLVPARDADEFADLIPNARKVVFQDTGHVAMLERPAAFNALLEAFLDEERASASPRRTRPARRSAAHRGSPPLRPRPRGPQPRPAAAARSRTARSRGARSRTARGHTARAAPARGPHRPGPHRPAGRTGPHRALGDTGPSAAQRTVTAPSEALPTSAAYLASTPVRSRVSGAS